MGGALSVRGGHVGFRRCGVATDRHFALAGPGAAVRRAAEFKSRDVAAVADFGWLAVTFLIQDRVVAFGHLWADAYAKAAVAGLTQAVLLEHGLHLRALRRWHVGHRLLNPRRGGGHLARHIVAVHDLFDDAYFPEAWLEAGACRIGLEYAEHDEAGGDEFPHDNSKCWRGVGAQEGL